MCAYNGVNGEPSCENKYLLAEVLRKDWKFPGFVLSDWGATHTLSRPPRPASIMKSHRLSSMEEQ